MRVLKQSFNAGEFSPKLYNHSKLAKYENGCKTLTNFIPLPHGSAVRRPGFEYIAEVKDGSQNVRLIPFEYSETDSYVIEAGEKYCRFYRNGGQVLTVDEYTKLLCHFDGVNNSIVITDNGDTGHEITIEGNAQLKTSYKKYGSSSLYFNSITDGLTIPDASDFDFGSSPFTIDFWVNFWEFPTAYSHTFYVQADDSSNYQYFDIYKKGSGDYYLRFIYDDGAGSNYIIRTWADPSLSTWYHIAIIRGWGGNADDFAITVNGELLDSVETLSDALSDLEEDVNIGYSLILNGLKAPLAYIDELRISAGIARWTANFSVPSSQYPAGDGSGTVYELTTVFTQDILNNLYYVQSADTMYIVHEDHEPYALVRNGHDDWEITKVTFTNAPDEWASSDYPRTIDFYEDRLVFGGNPGAPDSIYTSDSGDYVVFSEDDASEEESVQVTLGARRINDIVWMVGSRRLLIGTRGEEWWVSGPSDTEPLTPKDHVGKTDSAWGSERVRPENIGDAVFYVQRNGRILREMRYDYASDRYISSDVSILAEHLTKDYKIKQIAYQQHPHQVMWCLREDGVLLALSYMKEHEVLGWSKHTTNGTFESIAVIPGDSEDELWVVVKRSIDGSYVKYVERMKKFNWGTSLSDCFFVDSGLTYSGPAATEISGLDHLEGELVVALADGVTVSGLTVSSGTITLGTAASKVHIGLANTPELETLDVSYDEYKSGPLHGLPKRITNISVFLINSLGGLFGADSSHTNPIPYDDDTELFTGWTDDLPFPEGSDKDSTAYFKCDEPLPLEIGAINFDLED